jgi:hypothetical protein
MSTAYHAKYFALELTRKCSTHQLEKLNQSIFNATVDLNPHQIDAVRLAATADRDVGMKDFTRALEIECAGSWSGGPHREIVFRNGRSNDSGKSKCESRM